MVEKQITELTEDELKKKYRVSLLLSIMMLGVGLPDTVFLVRPGWAVSI